MSKQKRKNTKIRRRGTESPPSYCPKHGEIPWDLIRGMGFMLWSYCPKCYAKWEREWKRKPNKGRYSKWWNLQRNVHKLRRDKLRPNRKKRR